MDRKRWDFTALMIDQSHLQTRKQCFNSQSQLAHTFQVLVSKDLDTTEVCHRLSIVYMLAYSGTHLDTLNIKIDPCHVGTRDTGRLTRIQSSAPFMRTSTLSESHIGRREM